MSRIGGKVILIPSGVTVTKDGSIIKVVGPNGELKRSFLDNVNINIDSNSITLDIKRNDKFTKSLWGTYARHIENMINGVQNPYKKKLILEGVGFKSEVQNTSNGQVLNFALGFSHPVLTPVPDGIKATAEKNVITITGIDKELVGSFSAFVRGLKKPEPYKGKGFHYDDEVVRRKQGKKVA